MELPSREELLKTLIWVPCDSKESLHSWVKVYLGIDLPDCTVDPESTSNPTDFLWEAYSRMMRGDEDFSRCLFYAARDCFKTLLSSIIELLAVLHVERNVAHMASIESQSMICQGYIENYAKNPYIEPFITQSSKRRIEITKYVSADGEVIPPATYKGLLDSEKSKYTAKTNFVQIVIATMNGANSLHAQLMLLDELDLADPAAVTEAKMIPTPTKDGKAPVTLLTSSRKFAFGLVQKEIDDAEVSGLHLRHWNIIDVTQPCPTARHMPELPKIPIYYNDDEITAISEEEYNNLPPEKRLPFLKDEGYQGCISKCRLFAACRGRLATDQKSKSTLLKPVAAVQNTFRSLVRDPDAANAQLRCRKPSTTGLVYPRFNRDKHMITAAEMAEKITGDKVDPNFSKEQLIALMKSHDLRFWGGLDHGFSHHFSVTTGAQMGRKMFVFDVISAPELEISEKIDVMKMRFTHLGVWPAIYPDTEDPGSNKTLAKHFKIRTWQKTPGSVVGGVNVVRGLLTPTMGREPDLYFLKGDEGCELMAKMFTVHHWKLDAAGNPTDVPDDEGKDELDSLRYLCMNVFGKSSKIAVAPDKELNQPQTYVPTPTPTQENWMVTKIQELTADGSSSAEAQAPVKRGSFFAAF